MKQKINIRLALVAAIAVIATTIGVTLVYYNIFQNRVRSDLKTNAEILSNTGMFQELYADQNTKDIHSFDEMKEDGLRITWIDSDGTVLYDNDTDETALSNHLDRPEVEQALEEGRGESVRKSDTMNMDTFYYALLLDDGTILRVSTDTGSIASVFLAAIPVLITIAAAIIVICILLGHMLTRQFLNTLNKMAEHLDEKTDVVIYKELKPFADKIRSQNANILAAAKIRQDFTANVSHELKTPLTAISGYAELIENNMIDPGQEVHIAQEIRHNAERLLILINDIIKLSELDSNEAREALTPVDLYEVAKECCSELQVNTVKNNITLKCQGSSAVFAADREMMRELIYNLVQNAIRYNKPNGYVNVYARKEEEHAVLIVEDNGIGIPKDKQERIFERFYRVDKSRSRESGGTGLGLAIVKHIAQLHDAKIDLESDAGKGCRIKVTF